MVVGLRFLLPFFLFALEATTTSIASIGTVLLHHGVLATARPFTTCVSVQLHNKVYKMPTTTSQNGLVQQQEEILQ